MIILLLIGFASSDKPPGFGSAKHVLIIGCDGFGGMYLENATGFLPTFQNYFYDLGSFTTRARNQMPTISAPNWGTIITGMNPEDTGISDNDWIPPNDNPPNPVSTVPPISGAGKIPETMWREAKRQNPALTVAVSISWDWLYYLTETDNVDYLYRGLENDGNVANQMANFILENQPNLMFVHFDDIDDAGHESYWGSERYYNATRQVDGFIQIMINALVKAGIYNETLIITTADHGGYSDRHGDFNEANIYIPALFHGVGVHKNLNLTDVMYITNRDFAPTALNALGLDVGTFMSGHIVTPIYL